MRDMKGGIGSAGEKEWVKFNRERKDRPDKKDERVKAGVSMCIRGNGGQEQGYECIGRIKGKGSGAG